MREMQPLCQVRPTQRGLVRQRLRVGVAANPEGRCESLVAQFAPMAQMCRPASNHDSTKPCRRLDRPGQQHQTLRRRLKKYQIQIAAPSQ